MIPPSLCRPSTWAFSRAADFASDSIFVIVIDKNICNEEARLAAGGNVSVNELHGNTPAQDRAHKAEYKFIVNYLIFVHAY